MTKKSSKKAPKKTKAQLRAEAKDAALQAEVKAAKRSREENKRLLQELRRDPGMADDVKEMLCADLRRIAALPREIFGPGVPRRDRYRRLGYYSTSLVDFIYGQWAEFIRQAGLADTLHTNTVRRNIARTNRAQDLANYADEHIKPWDGAYDRLKLDKKPVVIQIGSDFHSYFCDPLALRMWRDVMKDMQPDAVRYNGDLVDFPTLSTHRQFPGHFPMTVQDELDWAQSVLATDRKNNPKGDHKFVIGNHDVRLAIALADKGPMFASLRSNSFAEQFALDKNEVGLVCRSNFLHLTSKQRERDIAQNWEEIYCPRTGRLLFVICHGWLCGKDAPRKHMLRFMCNGTNGHLHDRQRVSAGSRATGVHDWFQTSCMASPEAVAAGYIHGPVEFTGWTCGFLVVTIHPESGHVSGEFAEVGKDIGTFRGKVWKRTQRERDIVQEMLEI